MYVLIDGESYVEFAAINRYLGFTALRDRGQIVDINVKQDWPYDASLWHSTLHGKFI